MHPGQPRDVDLADWLNGVAFHPADSRSKQLGHAIVRQSVANLGGLLHSILPPGQDKSVAFRHLTDLMMYATRALAINGGPRPVFHEDPAEELESLALMNDSLVREGEVFGAVLAQDPRIKEYEAQQRGEETDDGPLAVLPFPVPGVVQDRAARDPFAPGNRPPLTTEEQEDADVSSVLEARSKRSPASVTLPPL